MTDTSDKVRINPALVAALEHYASVLYDPKRPSIFVYEDKSGARHSWPIERACRVAAEVLADEDLLLMKRIKALPPMTAEQVFEQRVSWAYSMVSDPAVTKEQVRAVLLRQDGREPLNDLRKRA